MMGDIQLKAGNLNLIYQDGFIRYVKLGEIEIIRMINHAVRDQNWGTVPMHISNEKVITETDAFQLSYSGNFNADAIDFEINCQIVGGNDGSLSFTYDGIAQNDFKRNRIGFTVLHPIQLYMGQNVGIVHSDYSISEQVFPELISAHQPFMDISEMHWNLENGIEASLFFEGEVFETEDQRNWTDASYKTYCTPLELPFPVEVKKGDKIHQKVTLKVRDTARVFYANSKVQPIKISLQKGNRKLPKFGIVLNRIPMGKLLDQLVQDLSPDFLRVDLELDLDYSGTMALLDNLAEKSIPIELAIFSDKEDPKPALRFLEKYDSVIKSILLFGDSFKTTPDSWINALPQLGEMFPQAEIYGGTDAFFTELNRDRVDATNLDGVTYSINPQVHAFDDQSLIESLEAQAYTVQSAKEIYPGKSIRVSPISFHMRWNPNATDPGKRLREPTGWTDDRQFSFFGACWFLISFKYLAEMGVSSATYFDLTGASGWIKAGENEKSPIYALREEIKGFNSLMPIQSSQPLLADAIFLKNGGEVMLLLVNWTDRIQLVAVPEGFRPVRVSQKMEHGKLLWENLKDDQVSEYHELKGRSLTWFTI